jgi:uncharacterized protein (DUF2147 family)
MSAGKMLVAILLILMMPDRPCLAVPGIQGLWLTGNDESTVEITRTEEGWIGRIVALKEPLTPEGGEKTDYQNPDPERRQDPIIGLRILWGFQEDNHTWTGGYVYDPNNGKTYHATMRIRNRQLHLRGSLDRWGLVGRSTVWNRPLPMDAP